MNEPKDPTKSDMEQRADWKSFGNLRVDDPWICSLLTGIAASLVANLLAYLLKSGLGFLEHWEIVVIAVFMGIAGTVITSILVKTDKLIRLLAATLVFIAVVGITCWVGFAFLVPHPVAHWDFEDGTTQDWGIYVEDPGRVIHKVRVEAVHERTEENVVSEEGAEKAKPEGSRDGDVSGGKEELVAALSVIDLSQEFPDRGFCLEVQKIDFPADSDVGESAVKQWSAVQYEGELASTKLTASVYIPADAEFRYADAKLFLFAGPKWEWHDNGTGGDNEGVPLIPGKWVDMSWHLRPHNTVGWAEPWPWRGIFGIQVYIGGGEFQGPVYIDDVKVWK